MNLNEFLQKASNNSQWTFTIAKAVKDENTPFYHEEYYQTPIRSMSEWIDSSLKDYIVINPDSCPVDITGIWQNWYNKGHLNCAIITTEKDLYTHYNEEQAKDMIKYYDDKIREWLKSTKKGI